MKKYVAGFLFSEDGAFVALVEKQKPDWQKWKLNAIGGKIEEGENALQAMQREFKEEAGLHILDWTPFCILYGKDFEVNFFSCFSDDVYKAKTMEQEEIVLVSIASVNNCNIIPNLKWLIPMALEKGLVARVFDGS